MASIGKRNEAGLKAVRIAGLVALPAVLLVGCGSMDGFRGGTASQPAAATNDIEVSAVPNADAVRDHAVDQLVGRWVYEHCDSEGKCETVVRIYEETPETGLVRYTELYNGTSNEGFVGYDLNRDGFVEFDYPDNWDDAEFEHRYRSEDEAIRLFGETPFGGPEDRVLQWHLNEDGSTMVLSTGAGDVSAPPREFLNVIFSKVPIFGGDEDSN